MIAAGCQRRDRLSCVEDLAKRKACCREIWGDIGRYREILGKRKACWCRVGLG